MRHPEREEEEFEAVRVKLLGGFSFSVGSRTIEEGAWRLKKAAALVKLLALAPGHRIHREQVADLLWPSLDRRAAANNFHHALHHARSVLGPATSSHLRLGEGQLALCPDGQLWVDVEAFEEAARAARRAHEPAAYRAAIELYAGDLLPRDRYEAWAEERRAGLRTLHLALMVEMARLLEERGEREAAIEALGKVVAMEPTHEEARVGLMRLYAGAGRRVEALSHYERLREALGEELDEEPSAASKHLHDEIKAGRALEAPPPARSSPEASPGARHNLPTARTSFVGREQELVKAERALATTHLLSSGNLVGGPANAAQNVISGNGANGVSVKLASATGNIVSNNHIGTDADAEEDLGNSGNGVFVDDAPGNTIGGSSADGTLNIISGNDRHGVEIIGNDASGNKVLGNLIGLNRNGNGFSNIGNTLDGVRVSSAPQTEIGGTLGGQGNTISDNRLNGVDIDISTDNKVLGNRIGTNTNGNSAFGNGRDGVRIVDSSNTQIGGTSAGARNVISGNRFGVDIRGSAATGNRVSGNFIGTDANGTSDLGNSLEGVFVSNAPGNTLGGTVAAAANTIAFNGADGVSISGATATGNRILRNSIFSNGGLGIDLLGGTENAAGATANDPKDPDAGPNYLQNKTVLTSFSGLAVDGKLNSTPNRTFVVQFFANPQGVNEGKSFLGQKSVTTNSNGTVTFTFTAAAAPIGTQNVTATATRAGNTSEFSQARVVE